MTETPQFQEPRIAANAAKHFDAPEPTNSKASIPPGVRKAVGKIGGNRKPRSGVRKLTEEDRQKIADYYTTVAFFAMPFKQEMAEAIVEEIPVERDPETKEVTAYKTRAELCADAWYELSEQNDSVRRMLLFFVESGAWSKLFAANLPILMAALPENALSNMMERLIPRRDTEAEPTVEMPAA